VTVDRSSSDDNRVSVRTGTSDDADGVLALWRAAGAQPTTTDDRASLVALLSGHPDALLIAESESRMVGTLIASWDGWRGSMYRLAVLPDCRRRGIAALLVDQGERRLRALGCRRIQALVVGADARANAFWTAVDYRPDALRRFVRTVDTVDTVDNLDHHDDARR
jgi:ribosomal protein S18 acetylase RimI-like enzyme